MITATSVVTVAVLLLLGGLSWSSYRHLAHEEQFHNRILVLRGEILRLDEVLTMAAYMAAETGDGRWEERYRLHEPLLADAIREARVLAPGEESAEASARTDLANARLVEMEMESFERNRAGDPGGARRILYGSEYLEQKKIYREGMDLLERTLDHTTVAAIAAERNRFLLAGFLAGVVLLLLAAVQIAGIPMLRSWRSELERRIHGLRALALDMAHEVNNPLTVVLQNLETIEEDLGRIPTGSGDAGGLVSDLRARASDGVACGRRIAEIVEDLSAFANAAEGEKRAVDLDEEVAAAIRAVARENPLGERIETDLAPRVRVSVDAIALTRALVRVLRGVLAAAEPGEEDGNRISVRLAAESGEARIRIRRGREDTAPPAEGSACTFRNECHACPAEPECRSTGLGLALSHGTFESFGGKLRLCGVVGNGIEVEIRLPLEVAA